MLVGSRAAALALVTWLAPLSPLAGDAHASALAGASHTLTWKRKSLALDDLPAELDPAARAALATWGPWAEDRGYTLRLSDDGRFLFGQSAKRGSRKAETLLDQTLASFDELLPASPPSPPLTGGEARTEGEPVGDAGVTAEAGWNWGEGPAQLESETAVLLALDGPEDLAAAVEQLAAQHAFLKEWAASARAKPGFLLERPLCAGYLLAGDGLEEYQPDNELVHRATQLACVRRVGHQPAWLQIGLAWWMEAHVLDGIWCFPGRTDFVGRGEHGDWDRALRNLYKKSDALSASEVLGLERGNWSTSDAHCAFGLVAHLARSHRDVLPALAKDFHAKRLARAFVTDADGRWEWKPEVELTLDEQAEVLEKRLGHGWLEELLGAWKKGKL